MAGSATRSGIRRTMLRAVACSLTSLLVMTLGQAPAWAAPEPEPEHLLAAQSDPVRPARKAPATRPPSVKTGVPFRPDAPVWPQAATVEVDLTVAASRSASAAVPAAGTPVLLGEPATAAGRSAQQVLSRAQVQVYSRQQALAAGVDGVLLRVTRTDGVASVGATRIGIDYGTFASAYGADWAARLRLVRLPECALSTPQAAGCRGTVLPSHRNNTAKTVSADVVVAGTAALVDSQHAETAAAAPSPATVGTLVALTAGTSSGAGDYAATSLQPSSTWAAGGNAGGFTWSYPMRVPPALAGPAPKLALAYSSQSVDGRMAASNNQPSWVGEGFEFAPGFVERRYRPCGKDMTGGNNSVKTGDLCWATDNATLSMNGTGGELLFKAGEEWRARVDDGSRIQRKTGGPNADNNGEYWIVTTPDGTQYWFGGRAGSNAVWTVPVYGNHPGEPCHQATFAASQCSGLPQAWRWNLDHVVDPRGNTMTYTYVKETNRYARNNTASDAVVYDRGGYLDRIDYGSRTGSSATAPMRVQIYTADRCLTSCWSGGNPVTANWPDTPFDTQCTGSPCYVSNPTFWTARRLAKVTTQLWTGSGSSYSNVESWTLTHGFPDPGDTTRAGLWLEKISHTGHVGGDTTVPDILLQGVQLQNRVDTTGDWAPAMNWWRIQYITTETGGRIAVTYANQQCVAGSVIPAQVHNNILRCYPVKWTPEGYITPVTDWMHKYLVMKVAEEDHALGAHGSDPVETSYVYVGDPAWHYTDDDGLIDSNDKTWSVWRGYSAVRTTKGKPGEQQVSEARYFRGMHGDKQPSGTRTVTLTAVGAAPAVTDEDAYGGAVRETIAYQGAAEVSAAVFEPWQSPTNATRAINGTTVTARHTGLTGTWTRTARDNGRPARTTTSRTTFDAYGMPVKVDDTGDDAVAGDERCALTGYEPRNTTAWLIAYPHREQMFGTSCTVATNGPLTVDDIVSDSRAWYDQATSHGTAPSKGLMSKVEELTTWTPGPGVPGTPGYLTVATASHDPYGRVTARTNVRGNTVTAGYTHNAGGQLASTTTTNHLTWQTVTTLQPAWGAATSTVDPNGRRIDVTHDGLGRTTAVWLPGRDKAGGATATMTFGYTVRNNAATVVTTSRLTANPAAGYITSYAFYDSLLRPRQTQASWAVVTSTGRIITDTLYDSVGRVALSYGGYAVEGAAGTDLYPKEPEATKPAVTKTLYDPAGRPTDSVFSTNGAEKWRTTIGYGGDRTDTTPPQGGTATSTRTDVYGRTSELRQYHGTAPTPWTAGSYDTTSYTHNREGQLTTVTDPAGNHWDYGYDLRGRTTQTVDPDGGTRTATYNDADDLTTITDSRGEVLAYTYDSLGRPTTLRDDTTTGPKRVEWTYDTLTDGTPVRGLPVKATRYADPNTDGVPDAYTTEILGYNTDYTPTATLYTIPAAETGLAGSFQYGHTYWPDGSPSTTTLPDIDGAGGLNQERLSYTYNLVGLPDQLKTNFGGISNNTYITNTTYTQHGEPTRISLKTSGASLVEQTRYYQEGTRRLTNINTSRVVSPSSVTAVGYTHDPAGNITKIADTTAGDHQCFAHDRLRRLTEAWTPANGDCLAAPSLAGLGGPAKYWSTWTFDTVGNRQTQTAFNPTSGLRDTTTYTHPNPGVAQPHTLLTATTGGTTHSYRYDPAGNTICRPAGTTPNTCPAGTGSQTLTWDAEGHLDKTLDSTGETSYLYGPDGNRLIRRDPTGKTLYLPSQELRYTASSNSKTTSRYYSWTGDTIAVRTTAGLTWLAGDHHNTTSHAITAATQTVATRRQTPYGTIRATGGTWPTGMNHGFVDGTNDTTGLTHLGAREYDPTLGRFISVDPLADLADPQQLHGYTYANNNPTTYTDPDGLCPCITDGGGDGYMDNRPDIYAEFDPGIGAGPAAGLGAKASKNFRKAAIEKVGQGAKKVKRWFTGEPPNAVARRALDAATDARLRSYHNNIGSSRPHSQTGPGRYFPADDFPAGPPTLKRNQTTTPPKPPAPPGGGKGAGRGQPTNTKPSNQTRTTQAKNCAANSFLPGTKVVLADGRTKPIENINKGDQVLATDPHTGTTAAKPVAATITGNGTKHLVRITISGGRSAGLEQSHVVATDGHPFWLPKLHQWVKAANLQPGQWLQTSAGTWIQITAIQHWTQPATVHNLTITDIHTYYVWAVQSGILVHNSGPCPQHDISGPGWDPEIAPCTGGPNCPRPSPDRRSLETGEPRGEPHPIAEGSNAPGGEILKNATESIDQGDLIGGSVYGALVFVRGAQWAGQSVIKPIVDFVRRRFGRPGGV